MHNITLYTCNSSHITKTCLDMFIPSSGIIYAKLKTSCSQQNNTILHTVEQCFSTAEPREAVLDFVILVF